jgi:hypothetical protein
MRLMESAQVRQDAIQYAARGLWYDALMALEPTTQAGAQRQLRASLLEQAGLREVAASERQR